MFGGLFRMAGQVFGGGKPAPAPKPPAPKPAPAPTAKFFGPGGDPSGSGVGQAMRDIPAVSPQQKAVSDTLSFAEGTWNKAAGTPDYAIRYGDRPGEASLDLTKPHPGDVRSSAYGSGYASNASGAFQFKDDTWREMHGGVNAVMSPENQDIAVGKLITQTGYDVDAPFAEQASKLSGRWASIPNEQGVSDYGQPTPHSAQELDAFHRDRLAQNMLAERMRVYSNRGGNTAAAPSAPAGVLSAPVAAAEPPAPSLNSYTVQSGDTLTGISNQLGVSIEELARRNNIEDINMIRAGANLIY